MRSVLQLFMDDYIEEYLDAGSYDTYQNALAAFDKTFKSSAYGRFIIEVIDGAYKLTRFEMLRSAPGN